MDFRIGQVYKYYDIAASLGYNEGSSSMTGGLFYKNGVVVMIKDESGKDYDDRWDPYRPGVLTFYATLKSIRYNSGPLIDLPMRTQANLHFEKGDSTIILFSKRGPNYTYLGEFERIESEPTYIIRNNYRVPGFDVISKDPNKIRHLIDEYSEQYNLTEWSDKERLALAEMYNPLCSSKEDMHDLAMALHKTTQQIEAEIDNSHYIKPLVVQSKDLQNILIDIRDRINVALNDIQDNTESARSEVREKIFRYNVYDLFNNKCCLTGLSEKSLLQACRISPASRTDINSPMDPNCGLLLNKFHGSLFNDHLMTVTYDGDVLYSNKLKNSLGKSFDSMCLDNSHIEWPECFTPKRSAFKQHNECFYERES